MSDQIKKVHLSNGLNCCYRKMDYFPNYITMALVVKGGSMLERKGEKGLAHLLEHWLMSFWTFNLFDNINYTVEAHTDFNETIFYIKGPTEENNIYFFIAILNCVANGTFLDKKFFDRAKSDVLKEIAIDKGRREAAQILLKDSLYYDHFALGNKEDVENLQYTQVRSFFDKYYVINNMALEIVGDIPDLNLLHGYVKKTFKSMLSYNVGIRKNDVNIPDYKGQVFYATMFEKQDYKGKIEVYIKNINDKIDGLDGYIKKEIIEKITLCILAEELNKYLGRKNFVVEYSLLDLDKKYMFYCIKILIIKKCSIPIENLLANIKKILDDYDSISKVAKQVVGKLDLCDEINKNAKEYYKSIGMYQLLLECIDDFLFDRPIITYMKRCELYESIFANLRLKDVLTRIKEIIQQDRAYILYL